MQVIPIKTDIINPSDKLLDKFFEFVQKQGEKLLSGDILVISSKVLALTQGRIVDLSQVIPSETAKNLAKETYDRTMTEDPRFTQLVMDEADKVLPGNLHLTIKENVLIPAAGIDRSNIPEGFVIPWPKNPQASTDQIREDLLEMAGITDRKLGVVLSDSHCQPLRKGVIGLAIAWSGFEGVEDIRGEPDLYGKPLKVTQKANADNISSAAHLVMGEGNDCVPFVIVRNLDLKFTEEKQNNLDNFFPPGFCIFSGIYSDEFKQIIQ
jgi:coenzyme F420-0:L-glutamate ligase